jgi:hypothetical protein
MCECGWGGLQQLGFTPGHSLGKHVGSIHHSLKTSSIATAIDWPNMFLEGK